MISQRVYPFHWIKVHGWLMWLGMGLLMPVAIVLVRFSQQARARGDLKTVRTLVYTHIIIQVSDHVLSTFLLSFLAIDLVTLVQILVGMELFVLSSSVICIVFLGYCGVGDRLQRCCCNLEIRQQFPLHS